MRLSPSILSCACVQLSLQLSLLLSLLPQVLLSAVEPPPVAPNPPPPPVEPGIRLKDLCFVEGVRDNQLNGVGVVVGLEGSGDDNEAVLKAMRAYLERNRLLIDQAGRQVEGENIALVVVTATLPPFKKAGATIPCRVSAIGDADSLRGGVLLQTLLTGYDGKVYAAAQGPVSVGGSGTAGPGLVATGQDHQNVETTGVLTEGAIVEREVPMEMIIDGHLRLSLQEPDFTTANRVARALVTAFGPERVQAHDAASILLSFAEAPTRQELIGTIARIEELRVIPDERARVVINERTGTVVVGSSVRIAPVAVSHGGLSLQVRSVTVERQDPLAEDTSITTTTWNHPAVPQRLNREPAGVHADPEAIPGSVTVLEGTTVEEIANALNALGARPRDMVAIFQAIHRAGALHAELVLM